MDSVLAFSFLSFDNVKKPDSPFNGPVFDQNQAETLYRVYTLDLNMKTLKGRRPGDRSLCSVCHGTCVYGSRLTLGLCCK